MEVFRQKQTCVDEILPEKKFWQEIQKMQSIPEEKLPTQLQSLIKKGLLYTDTSGYALTQDGFDYLYG